LSYVKPHPPFWVECSNCGASGPNHGDKQGAILCWERMVAGPPKMSAEGWAEARAAFAVVDDWFRSLGGDDRASDGEQNAEAGNLAPASPVVHPTPPSDTPTIAFDDPRHDEWQHQLQRSFALGRRFGIEEVEAILRQGVRPITDHLAAMNARIDDLSASALREAGIAEDGSDAAPTPEGP
jgi:hypothetical protein